MKIDTSKETYIYECNKTREHQRTFRFSRCSLTKYKADTGFIEGLKGLV